MTDVYRGLRDALSGADAADWKRIGRANQQPPPGDWRIWLLLAGRGFGKTRTICEFVRAEVERGTACRIAFVGATASATRDVLITGHSGILAISQRWNQPIYEPTKRLLTWPNGAIATCYSAEEVDQLRGPQHDLAICDELAAWRYPEALDMLLLGLRIGKNPRVAIATTPRPTKVIRDLLARAGRDVAVTRGATLENASNLAPAYIEQIIERYRGTRLERQEIFGELLQDVVGALWNHENLEQTRVAEAPAQMQRVVVAVDPAGSSEEGADETGVIVAGIDQDDHAYVLADMSGRYEPAEWARVAINAWHVWKADVLVAETNFGGRMVAGTIAAVDPSVPVKEISSSRGKVLRAEPIAAFFEQRRAHMVGSHPELEDQMCRFTPDWDRGRDGSPDRIDAAVFALTELLLQERPGGFIRPEALLQRPDATGQSAPVDVPREVESVFAFAAITEAEPDALGVVHFAVTGRNPSVVVLDWDVMLLEQATLDAFFPAVAARLEELVKLTAARSTFSPLLVEPTALGAMLLEQGHLRGHRVQPLVDEELLEKELPIRVVEIGNYLHSGSIKLARPAHEKAITFKGVYRNHLTAELAAFTLTEKPKVGALTAAFATGAAHAFGGQLWLDVWRALGSPEPSKLAPLGAVREVAPEPPPAPLLRPDRHVLGPNHPAVIRAAELRRQNEARCERERTQARESARIREARMAQEESR